MLSKTNRKGTGIKDSKKTQIEKKMEGGAFACARGIGPVQTACPNTFIGTSILILESLDSKNPHEM